MQDYADAKTTVVEALLAHASALERVSSGRPPE